MKQKTIEPKHEPNGRNEIVARLPVLFTQALELLEANQFRRYTHWDMFRILPYGEQSGRLYNMGIVKRTLHLRIQDKFLRGFGIWHEQRHGYWKEHRLSTGQRARDRNFS